MKPLAIDLFCGLGGWCQGLQAASWEEVIGFDIERHDYGSGGYPGQLVLQDVRTLHGCQFRDADLIVASPPCQEFSMMAMPFSRGKRIAKALRGEGEFPDGYKGSRTIAELTALFDACFRIQREACEAAGRHIPMVVENVNGAQPWVGRSRYCFGSYHLWGDIPALMVSPSTRRMKFGSDASERLWRDRPMPTVNDGESTMLHRGEHGVKVGDLGWQNRRNGANGPRSKRSFTDSQKSETGWFSGPNSHGGSTSSRALARKAASAKIAMIPFALAKWIGECYLPDWAREGSA